MSNLLVIGLIIGSVLAIFSWVAALRRQENGRWYDTLLALATVILSVVALSLENGMTVLFDTSELLMVILGVVLILPGARILLLAEKPFASGGFLAASVGIILVGAALVIPQYAEATAQDQTVAIPGAANAPTLPSFPLQAINNQQFNGDAVEMLSVPEPVELLQAIPTLDRPELIFMTPTPNPLLAQQCDATVTTRLNLRDQPSTASGAVVSVVAENTEVLLVQRDADSEWWYMLNEDEEREGWLFGDFLELADNCELLPVRSS